MAVIPAERSSYNTYPGGKVSYSLPINEWQSQVRPESAYVPAIEPNNAMVHVLYLKGKDEGGHQTGFFEQTYPWRKKYKRWATAGDHHETLAHYGVPPAPEYDQQPAAVLWTPIRKEITVVQLSSIEGRVTQVASEAPPPVDHKVLPSGIHLIGTLTDLGFDKDDFRFLAQGTRFDQQTGLGGLLRHIMPKAAQSGVEKATAGISDAFNATLPTDIGYLKNAYRAVLKHPVQLTARSPREKLPTK